MITLNVNELNALTERHRRLNGLTTRPNICCLQETPHTEGHIDLKKGWKKVFHANRNQKKAAVAILIPDKTDFKIKTWQQARKDSA